MKRILLACLLAAAPMAAVAIPVLYEVTFTATSGPNGFGQFTWDADTLEMTGFTWDFGGGQTGGITDFALLLDIADTIGDPPGSLGTPGALIWENITGEDTSPLSSAISLFGPALLPGTTFTGHPNPAIGFLIGGRMRSRTRTRSRLSARASSACVRAPLFRNRAPLRCLQSHQPPCSTGVKLAACSS
jgi:hypothetical protein